MQRDTDRSFSDPFGQPMARWQREEEGGIRIPSIDLIETEQEVVVKVELPGIDKDQMRLEVTPERLSLSAETKQEKEHGEGTLHHRERIWGRFERTIPLPAEVSTDQVNASLENGLLEVHLPKSERAKAATPKKVTVK
jgi:HSP20 family protein